MITDVQYKRLPPLFREIIDHQQQLDEMYALPAVPLKETIEHIKRKRELKRAAARQYQPGSLRGGPKAHA